MKKSKTPRANRTQRFLLIVLSAAGIFASGSLVEAAIPSSKTIFGRLARKSGKGVYSIEQEVQFRSLAEPVVLRERWVVAGGESLRLTVTSPKSTSERVRLDVLYRDGRRTAPDFVGGLRSTTIGQEFFEPYSHFRSGRSFAEALVFSRILPASFLKERPRLTATTGPGKGWNEEHVRLGRSGGVVTWVFGDPTPVDAQRLNPSAWVEQDGFVMRRLRFPSQAEVAYDNPTTYANGLRLARDRTISWDSNTVTIRVISVKALSDSAGSGPLAPNSLTPSDAQAAQLPDVAVVKEFYSRFR